jgi:nucleotide-binding universal stress UspA family protein
MAAKPGVFSHILVPVDGSQPSVAAGRLAIRLAASQDARLTFAYVVDTIVAGELTGVSGQAVRQVQGELELTGQRFLNHLCRLAAEAQMKADQVIRRGRPYVEIADLAKEQGVDLIVIARVGQHGPRRILIGSVTERVIEYAPCPVLVVK